MQNKVFLAIFPPARVKCCAPVQHLLWGICYYNLAQRCMTSSSTSLAASQICVAECICTTKSNVVGRKGGYSKKEFPLSFVDLYAKSVCGKILIKLLQDCVLGGGAMHLVCSVLPSLYHEGAKCNLGLLQQWGCWGISGMWLLLPGRRTPNNNCSIQPFIWALSWPREMPSQHWPTVEAPDHQETLNNL